MRVWPTLKALLNADVLVAGVRLANVDGEPGVAERERGVVDDESRRDITISGNVALGNRRGVELRRVEARKH